MPHTSQPYSKLLEDQNMLNTLLSVLTFTTKYHHYTPLHIFLNIYIKGWFLFSDGLDPVPHVDITLFFTTPAVPASHLVSWIVALPFPPYQLYLFFSYISNCIVSYYKDHRTNAGLISGTATCLLQLWFLMFCFIPCCRRLPTKPISAGTDMRSQHGTGTETSIQVRSKGVPVIRETRSTDSARGKKKKHEGPPSSLSSSKKWYLH